MAGRDESLRLWIAATFVVAVSSFIVDQNTGDTTGPPYDDSLLNQAAFFVFFGAAFLMLGRCLIAFVRWIRGRVTEIRRVRDKVQAPSARDEHTDWCLTRTAVRCSSRGCGRSIDEIPAPDPASLGESDHGHRLTHACVCI